MYCGQQYDRQQPNHEDFALPLHESVNDHHQPRQHNSVNISWNTFPIHNHASRKRAIYDVIGYEHPPEAKRLQQQQQQQQQQGYQHELTTTCSNKTSPVDDDNDDMKLDNSWSAAEGDTQPTTTTTDSSGAENNLQIVPTASSAFNPSDVLCYVLRQMRLRWCRNEDDTFGAIACLLVKRDMLQTAIRYNADLSGSFSTQEGHTVNFRVTSDGMPDLASGYDDENVNVRVDLNLCRTESYPYELGRRELLSLPASGSSGSSSTDKRITTTTDPVNVVDMERPQERQHQDIIKTNHTLPCTIYRREEQQDEHVVELDEGGFDDGCTDSKNNKRKRSFATATEAIGDPFTFSPSHTGSTSLDTKQRKVDVVEGTLTELEQALEQVRQQTPRRGYVKGNKRRPSGSSSSQESQHQQSHSYFGFGLLNKQHQQHPPPPFPGKRTRKMYN
jgi:hypothetical protein